MYRVTRELEFGELKVEVKELTVAEIRTWLAESNIKSEEPRGFDPILDILLWNDQSQDVGLNELLRFTSLRMVDIESLLPSDIEKISAVIKEVNRGFFQRFLPNMKKMQALVESQKTSLTN